MPGLPQSCCLVSLVVRTMAGREGALKQALASIAGQTWPRLQVVVVEDGSDSAGELVGRFAGSHPGRWQHLSLPQRVGRSVAGNAGLAACEGELIGFLDDDDQLYADHVECLAGALIEDPDAVAAHAMAWEALTEISSFEPWQARERRRLLHEAPTLRDGLLTLTNPFPIQSVLFRRGLYDRLGGFDESLDLLEDWNLWVRYATAGRFIPVGKLTSMFRTPADRGQRRKRLAALDRAYGEVRRHNARALGQPEPDLPGVVFRLRSRLRQLITGLPGGSRLLNRVARRRLR